MRTLVAALASIMLAVSPAHAAPSTLPESCAITAAIAVTELTQAGIWARPLGLKVVKPDGTKSGHILTVFSFAGNIYVYDADGSHRLETSSLDISVIVARIQAMLQPGWKIGGYAWLDESTKDLKETNK